MVTINTCSLWSGMVLVKTLSSWPKTENNISTKQSFISNKFNINYLSDSKYC